MLVDVDTAVVRGGFSTHQVLLARPASGNYNLALIVHPSDVIVDLAVYEDVVVGGWDWTFKTRAQWAGPGLGCVVWTRGEGEVPKAVEGDQLAGWGTLGLEI